MISTAALSCTYSNWLAGMKHLKLTTQSACMKWLMTLIDTKNFVLHCYPSLTVQEANISREHENWEKQWVITWTTESEGGNIGPVKPVHMVFSDDEKTWLKT